ncbi:MAG: tetratricopeptide repeat protein [Candidatus Thiodiazotropha endolucinida]|nr:tetratricopeptide repeat protein [Candidatus Thiodiazotropha taylori]MCW4275541.1 tetratricopeptide repeat protein [Candidatus Thiodiazotropha taylori]
MSTYQTEEEQVEAIKRWWKENGTSVIAGLVIGLGGVFGWQAWGNYQDRVGAEASTAFSQLVGAVQRGDSQSASKQAELLKQNFEGSSYATFAALSEARLHMEAGESDLAKQKLSGIVEQSKVPALTQMAQLSLARILLDEGDLAGAEQQVDVTSGSFAGEFAVIRGDIAHAKGDLAEAAAAYTEAMTHEVNDRSLLQMKLDDLAVAKP